MVNDFSSCSMHYCELMRFKLDIVLLSLKHLKNINVMALKVINLIMEDMTC